MPPSIRIAIRFLLAKKRSMFMSLGGIAFGVGFFIVTLAQVSGFEEFFIQTILGTDGAVRIEDRFQSTLASVRSNSPFADNRSQRKYIEGVENPDEIIEALTAVPNVAGTSVVLKDSASIDSPLRSSRIQVYGIIASDHIGVSQLEGQIRMGSIQRFQETPTGIIIGAKVADRIKAHVGDSVIIRVGDQQNRYRVSGIFETGVSDIDKVRVFMHLGQARSLFKKPHGVSFIQVSLFDRDRAREDAETIENITSHIASAWQDREKSWLEVFRAFKITGSIMVSTIILISGLGMFNTLAMIVMEKTREIAILRSMGYTRQDISNVFLWQGAVVLVVGTILGFLLGAAITYGISSVPLRIRGIFSTDNFVVNWSIMHYVYAGVTASIIVMLSSLLPARRAARLVPGDVIRGTSS
ncbi:ABC transporter permease [Puniceicoccaceae bacterium K14]|nr:ABC transporter permease [Puniceicoccaceae bacterium K14]